VQPVPEAGPADDDPAEQLRVQIHHFLGNFLAIGRTDDWHRVLLLREMIRPSPAAETLVREVIRPRFERLAAIVRRLRPDLEGRRLHATVFSIVGQCLHYKLARPMAERIVGPGAMEALDAEFLTGHITAFTLAALSGGAGGDGR
jgi:hypothetical protein